MAALSFYLSLFCWPWDKPRGCEDRVVRSGRCLPPPRGRPHTRSPNEAGLALVGGPGGLARAPGSDPGSSPRHMGQESWCGETKVSPRVGSRNRKGRGRPTAVARGPRTSGQCTRARGRRSATRPASVGLARGPAVPQNGSPRGNLGHAPPGGLSHCDRQTQPATAPSAGPRSQAHKAGEAPPSKGGLGGRGWLRTPLWGCMVEGCMAPTD